MLKEKCHAQSGKVMTGQVLMTDSDLMANGITVFYCNTFLLYYLIIRIQLPIVQVDTGQQLQIYCVASKITVDFFCNQHTV